VGTGGLLKAANHLAALVSWRQFIGAVQSFQLGRSGRRLSQTHDLARHDRRSRPHSCPFVCACLPATTAGNPMTSARHRYDQSTLVGGRDHLPCATDHDTIEHCRYFLRPCIATPRQAKGSEMILPRTETRELAASHVWSPVRADRLRDGSR
jgi:hypothetical protein